MRNYKKIIYGIIAFAVIISLIGARYYQKSSQESIIENQILYQKTKEQRKLTQEENSSYKHFTLQQIYTSDFLGKVTPNTSFAPDGQIISHSGKSAFEKEYVKSENEMAYILYKPTCVDASETLPLIVYLHGAGDYGRSIEEAEMLGLPSALSTWKLDGFHAYILCPQNPGGYWSRQDKAEAVMNLVNKISRDFPINLDKISIVGHSSGGGGALYINARSDGRFCAVVPVSAVDASPNEKKLGNAKMRVYCAVGDGNGNLKRYFDTKLKKIAGEEQSFFINATHLNSSCKALQIDQNQDGKSDLIEWVLSQKLE